jgi:TRAP-type C4-dicarboxylate transport system permease small subunit
MNKFDKLLSQVNDLLASTLFILMFVDVFGSVILRYVFGFSYRWSDELARYLFIYIVFLGIPIAFRENIHAKIEYFTSTFFKKMKHALQVFCDLLITLTIIYIGYYTITMMQGRLGKTLSSGLKLPMGYIYLSVIICIFLLLIELAWRFTSAYQHMPEKENIIDEVNIR